MERQVREIRYFFYSQAFADGMRTTFAVLLPALLASYLNVFEAGMALSLGAFCVSLTDAPGPIVHKRNSMLICCLFIFIVSLITAFARVSEFLMGLEVVVFSFLFSMFIVYGNRAASIGSAALLVMILSMDTVIAPGEALEHAALVVGGGIWYLLISLLLYQIQPYRPAQRALGDSIRDLAKYLSIKADFYNSGKDLDETYKKLLAQHVVVHENQDAVREVLFKTRQIVNETTTTGKKLVLQFVETVDLFEDITATYYDYTSLRSRFEDTKILDKISTLIRQIAIELDKIGIAIQGNTKYRLKKSLEKNLILLKSEVDAITKTEKQSSLVLKKILVNLRKLFNRYIELTSYFSKEKTKSGQASLDHSRFITHQSLDPKILLDNLTIRSSSFRHALRVAIACLAGFVIVKWMDYGNYSYWILLTIVFILKPAFSLTKKRNRERLIGTIAGGLIGVLILYFIPNKNVQFAFMVVFMILTYSFLRINYLVMVVFTTPFVIILFNFLGEGFYVVAQERLLDTVIGCAIAVAASYFLFPTWESEQFKMYMQNMLKANADYLKKVMEGLSGKKINLLNYKLVRKEVYVSSANLSAAFQRMLSEPKTKRENSKQVHQFVVLNHILFSNIATVVTGLMSKEPKQHPEHLQVITKKALRLLLKNYEVKKSDEEKTIKIIEDNLAIEEAPTADDILLKDQLEFIYKISVDIDNSMNKIIS